MVGKVAPHAGAWIETAAAGGMAAVSMVAPHAGAWIETKNQRLVQRSIQALPTRERGLKQALLQQC